MENEETERARVTVCNIEYQLDFGARDSIDPFLANFSSLDARDIHFFEKTRTYAHARRCIELLRVSISLATESSSIELDSS